jgi:hypothetical protein
VNNPIPNPILKIFENSVKQYLPTVFKPCPYTGKLTLENFKISKSSNAWIPPGTYQFNDFYFNEEDSLIFAISLILVKE